MKKPFLIEQSASRCWTYFRPDDGLSYLPFRKREELASHGPRATRGGERPSPRHPTASLPENPAISPVWPHHPKVVTLPNYGPSSCPLHACLSACCRPLRPPDYHLTGREVGGENPRQPPCPLLPTTRKCPSQEPPSLLPGSTLPSLPQRRGQEVPALHSLTTKRVREAVIPLLSNFNQQAPSEVASSAYTFSDIHSQAEYIRVADTNLKPSSGLAIS